MIIFIYFFIMLLINMFRDLLEFPLNKLNAVVHGFFLFYFEKYLNIQFLLVVGDLKQKNG